MTAQPVGVMPQSGALPTNHPDSDAAATWKPRLRTSCELVSSCELVETSSQLVRNFFGLVTWVGWKLVSN